MAVLGFGALMHISRARVNGSLSPGVEAIIVLVLFIAGGASVFLLRLRAIKKGRSADAKLESSVPAVDEQKQQLVRHRKRFIGYLLVAFAISEWIMKNDPLVLRLAGTALGLCFVGWQVWRLVSLQRTSA